MIKPNDGKHIDEVIDRTSCKRHKRDAGTPCWDIYSGNFKNSMTRAACGSRIKAAGFVGAISETSVQTKRKAFETKKKEVRS